MHNFCIDFLFLLENLITSKTEVDSSTLKIGNVVIETIAISGNAGIRTAPIKTSFKAIIYVSLASYISYGQQGNTSQTLHDSNDIIIRNKALRFYSNGNQTVNLIPNCNIRKTDKF